MTSDRRLRMLPGLHVDRPAVPGAAHDIAFHRSITEVPAHVGALIPNRVDRPIAAEQGDLHVVDGDDGPLPLHDVRRVRHFMEFGHVAPPHLPHK
jgi:hypothetical protein